MDAGAGVGATGGLPHSLYVYAWGLRAGGPIGKLLAHAGHLVRTGLPRPDAGVAVWGHSPHAWRGEWVAARFGLPLIRVEDALLRSLSPARAGGRARHGPPLGLMLDDRGVHYDPRQPSRLEAILAQHPLDDSALLARAAEGMARVAAHDLSKYNDHDPDAALPAPGYVLVVDQTRGDAAVRASGGDRAAFLAMLARASEDHPQARIVIKSHPETRHGARRGHFVAQDAPDGGRICLLGTPVSPRKLIEGAVAVYTHSSTMGFEAILAGHRPQVFGQPFYAGWGLTVDHAPPLARRGRVLSRTQLFAGAMILATTWVCPARGRLCSLEEALDQLEAEVRVWREDRHGHLALGMRLWKRAALQAQFGRHRPLRFAKTAGAAAQQARAAGRGVLVWGATPAPDGGPLRRVEDGFLRSRGLGAALIPPLSQVADARGLYYDPNHPSDLEALITAPLPPGGRARAEALVAGLLAAGVSKYNLPPAPPVPVDGSGRPRILVPGQVEDDASVRLGAQDFLTKNLARSQPVNRALLAAVRAQNPGAMILYKPHPDVVAGLRPGGLGPDDLAGLADAVVTDADPIAAIMAADAVWTLTSLLGFEALLRGKPVTCLGVPFYAGWGLTRDLAPTPRRRVQAADGHPLPRPDLIHVAHAALIDYPRYFDPVLARPCPAEVALHRLAQGQAPRPGPALRLLAKMQGALAGHAHLWRRGR